MGGRDSKDKGVGVKSACSNALVAGCGVCVCAYVCMVCVHVSAHARVCDDGETPAATQLSRLTSHLVERE
jgi:hypothetical protein